MSTFYKGDAIIIEVEIKRYTAFDDYAYRNPSNGVKISILDNKNTKLVSSASMELSATGKYYYIWQTTNSLLSGTYTCAITADDVDYDGYEEDTSIDLK